MTFHHFSVSSAMSLAKVGGREREHVATQVGKPRLDLGIGKARVDLLVELVDDLGERLLRRANALERAGLADPKIKARLANLGGDVLALSSADFEKLIADETEKWGNVIRALNIKAE